MKNKDQAKYDQIIEAASNIIVEDGYPAFSTTAVAKAVGIRQSNIYIYFKNKSALLDAVYMHHMRLLAQFAHAHDQVQATTTEQIQSMIVGLVDFANDHPDSLVLIMTLKNNHVLTATFQSETTEENQISLLDLLNKGAAENLLKSLPTSLMVEFVMSILYDVAQHHLDSSYSKTSVTDSTLADFIIDAIFK
ncbi:TetR/AcrR family transcriptional regulator [Weissella viridescens]|uniref:TetR/AcrR family transcriptional regulator n=1 Tax=Weissella viridescens TaxID=1629 RepID=A0A3P2RJJ0_WEIVI|nr:TetR/AcrR family transcriptional regulator [Weissella viridescens]RRG17608.1 TetR/AcrR family transcriptional regulator [Weissella viridescens]